MKIERLKEIVHKELNFSRYDSPVLRKNLNCYAHAINAPLCAECSRIGWVSGKIGNRKYFSMQDMKNLFLEDMKTLELGVEEITVSSKSECLAKIKDTYLEENQYLIVLFAVFFENTSIGDFHFWRYDLQKGLSEKRRTLYPKLIKNPEASWDNNMVLVGLFRITR